MASLSSRDKLIERVRALLAMTTANGCTEAEAMTAAAMAARLMQQHDLELGDVRQLKDERIAQQSKPFASDERPRELHAAGMYVAVAIGEFFDCKCWRVGTDIIFFGLKNDVPLAHAMLAMVRVAMDSELAAFLKSDIAAETIKTAATHRTLASSFLKGMGYRVSERIKVLKQQRSANVRASGTDLVVVKSAIVDAAFAEVFRGLAFKKPRPLKPPRDGAAFQAGAEAGNRVSLGLDREVAANPSTRPVLTARRQPSSLWSTVAAVLARGHRALRAVFLALSHIALIASYALLIPVLAADTYANTAKPFAERWPTWYVDAMPLLGVVLTITAAFSITAQARHAEAGRFAAWQKSIDEAHRLLAAGLWESASRQAIAVQFYADVHKTRHHGLAPLRDQFDILFWSFAIYLGFQTGPLIHDRFVLASDVTARIAAEVRLTDAMFLVGHLAMGLVCVALGNLLSHALWPDRAPVGPSREAVELCANHYGHARSA